MSSRSLNFYRLIAAAFCCIFLVGCKHKRNKDSSSLTMDLSRNKFAKRSWKKPLPPKNDTQEYYTPDTTDPDVIVIEGVPNVSHEIAVIEVERDSSPEEEQIEGKFREVSPGGHEGSTQEGRLFSDEYIDSYTTAYDEE